VPTPSGRSSQLSRTVQQEDEQNKQLLALSRRTLALTEEVRDAAGAGGPGSHGSERTAQDSKEDDA
jgi:hypothetical protein